MNELHLFAGAGGGILGGELLGHTTVCAVEIEKYPRQVLLQRQKDGVLPLFPVWDDIRTFDGKPWKGRVDIVAGGFPCQDISAAGKGTGIEGERSGLWSEMARVVSEIRPRFVFVENSPMLTSRGLGRVLGELSEMGYDARWCVLGADDAGGFHERKRLWLLAYPNSERELQQERHHKNKRGWPEYGHKKLADPGNKRCNERSDQPGKKRETIGRGISSVCSNKMAHTSKTRLQGSEQQRACSEEWFREKAYGSITECGGAPDRGPWSDHDYIKCIDGTQRAVKPGIRLLAHGVANRVDRIKAIGNGQVPTVVALAFSILSEGLV